MPGGRQMAQLHRCVEVLLAREQDRKLLKDLSVAVLEFRVGRRQSSSQLETVGSFRGYFGRAIAGNVGCN